MANENGTWIMYGVNEDDPECLHTVEDLIRYIDEIGFLPLFKNEIPGFSVEERTVPYAWWCDDPKRDPWIWREIIAGSHRVAYGKFFDKKAGFISLKWLPYFVNFRRDGYDFDSRWDDELASLREKKVMDVFEGAEEMLSYELKQKAGFGKDGEKNFEGIVTGLQMQTYLCMKAFRQKKNKKGDPYGMHVAVYAKPEEIWGREAVTAAYNEAPETSGRRIAAHISEEYPIASEAQIRKVLGIPLNLMK